MNWYKFMWLDAIEKVHSIHSFRRDEDKNFGLLWFFVLAQITNIVSIHFLLAVFKINFSPFVITKDFFINFLVLIFIPFINLVINYFIFFHKKKYVELLKHKEKKKGGKGFMKYIFISYGVCVILLILTHILNNY